MKNLLVCFATLGLGLALCGDIQAQRRGGMSWGIGSGGWGIGNYGGYGGYGGYGSGWGGYGSGWGYGPGYYGSGWGYGRGYYGSGLYLGSNRGYYSNYGWGGYYPSYSYSYYPSYSYGTYPGYAYNYPSYDYGNYYSGGYYGGPGTQGYSYSSAYGPSMGQGGQVPAIIEVTLPDPNATVLVNGKATQSKGVTRRFESPPLEPGKTYRYDLKVSWQQNGQTKTQAREIQVTPGDVTRVDFTQEGGQPGGPSGTGQNPNPNVNPNPPGNPNNPPVGNQPQNPSSTPPGIDKKG